MFFARYNTLTINLIKKAKIKPFFSWKSDKIIPPNILVIPQYPFLTY